MSEHKSKNMLLFSLLAVAAIGAAVWKLSLSGTETSGLGSEADPKASTPEEAEAMKAARKVGDPAAFKSAVDLMQKKNDVRTTVAIATISGSLESNVGDAEFDALWNGIPEADRINKSAEELVKIILAEKQGN